MTHIVDSGPTLEMAVRYEGGERYAVGVRGHTVVVDQPAELGGDDLAATPVELFVASLASCVAYSVGRYLTRHGISREGLGVTVSYRMADGRPARVTDINVNVQVPPALPEARQPALRFLIEHCTVHNSLMSGPRVHFRVHRP